MFINHEKQYHANEKDFINKLLLIGKRILSKFNKKIFLIPTNDEYLICLSKHWELLEQFYISVFETNVDVLRTCIDKKYMYQIAKRCGVLFPKTYENSYQVDPSTETKWIIKASYKDPSVKTTMEFRNSICSTIEELRNVENSKY